MLNDIIQAFYTIVLIIFMVVAILLITLALI